MKRLTFLIFSFFFFPSFLCAVSLRVGEVFSLPENSYVGDLVEMHIPVLEIPSGFIFNWEKKEQKESAFLEIRDVVFDEKKATFIVYYVSYALGRQAFAPIKVADNFFLEGLNSLTLSLAQEGIKVFPFKKALLIPGTEILFFLLISMVLCLPMSLFLLLVKLKKWFKALRSRYLFGLPYRQFKQEMLALMGYAHESSSYYFFSRLDQVVRTFLSFCLKENFSSYTTKEIRASLRASCLFNFQDTEILIDLFHTSDLVKYADYQINAKDRELTWQTISNLMQKFEKERKENANL